MNITTSAVVGIEYTLKDDQGEVVDSNVGHDELLYLHGHGNLVVGLEKALEGKTVGDEVEVSVSPEEGYGAHDPALQMTVPRSAFEGGPELEPGLMFQAETERGMQVFTITEIEGDNVQVDGNHALAGATLHFAVKITSVREAAQEEIDHGHVHGPGGHHH